MHSLSEGLYLVHTKLKVWTTIHRSTAKKQFKYSYILMQHTAARKGYLEKFEHTWNKYKDLVDTIH